MALISTENTWAFVFGLLGNIISFVCFLAPIPTFIRVFKKKSTEGFQSVPYVVALFSAMCWLFYGLQKSGLFLLITINSLGCVIETIYIAIFVAFAPKQARLMTLRLLLLLNLGGFCGIILLTHFFVKESIRAQVLGWICTAFATSVFAAPLSIMRVVIRTKSVEFMPFTLSFFLTISAVMWLLYGLSLKDYCIAVPNVLGLTFGVIQMVLYAMYRNHKTVVKEVDEIKVVEHSIDIMKLDTTVLVETQPSVSSNPNNDSDRHREIKDHMIEQTCRPYEKGLESTNPVMIVAT
ncbi:bidirectional sugar transporter SWEET12-like [Carica papaya]|uniref:bidirectional sugar transporter SWEET12-like n=1 Tax=Carica papaya TaxID=3649 RepID=UPI000B8CE588|nr:bidirectional sugar transporter SWEET12-like [Carica papaya]